MSRLFPSGSRIVASNTDADASGLRTLAGTRDSGRQVSVMVVNDADQARTVKIVAAGGARKALTIYRYFDGDRRVDANGFPVPAQELPATDLAKGLTVELPSRGVVFVTTR
jgi:hypothetical protein